MALETDGTLSRSCHCLNIDGRVPKLIWFLPIVGLQVRLSRRTRQGVYLQRERCAHSPLRRANSHDLWLRRQSAHCPPSWYDTIPMISNIVEASCPIDPVSSTLQS